VLKERVPDAVIHCAASTQVDRAEEEREQAYRVNALGPRILATVCAGLGIPLCAVSTDFVFDGKKEEPYTEFDPVGPLSVYGASKLAGEVAIREAWSWHWIVRTSWLYGLHGKCFPDTILKAAEVRPELTVVADQRGTPTFTEDLAEAIVRLIQYPVYGTYHAANSAENGSTTWYEFARTTLEMAGIATPVRPIATAEWPTPAIRPANSALRSYMFELQDLPTLRPWQEALHDYVEKRKLQIAK
jgi:dTDP-4-dehydrorhamnose reductase